MNPVSAASSGRQALSPALDFPGRAADAVSDMSVMSRPLRWRGPGAFDKRPGAALFR
jgi:hypothetical protein